jgi:hypothetical protein
VSLLKDLANKNKVSYTFKGQAPLADLDATVGLEENKAPQ